MVDDQKNTDNDLNVSMIELAFKFEIINISRILYAK